MNFRKGSWVKVSFEAEVQENGLYAGGQYCHRQDGKVRNFQVEEIDDPNTDPIGTIRQTKNYGLIVKCALEDTPWQILNKTWGDDRLDSYDQYTPVHILGPIVFRPEETND